jgi:nicotinamide-nucleotide amidase
MQVEQLISIADTRKAIHEQLDAYVGKVDLMLFTGGLGPTQDDITKPALEAWFGGGWKTDARVLQRVQAHFEERGIKMPEINAEQADVPAVCEVLYNAHGSAPGMLFEQDGTIVVSMPGVPFEMKSIFTDELLPRITDRLMDQQLVHRTVHTQGIGESSLMEIITGWESKLRTEGLKLAYLPSVGAVRLRISATGSDRAVLHQRIDAYIDELLPLIDDYAFGFDGDQLEQVVGKLLKRHDQTLAVAESCTGGYIAHLLTSIPGSSAYFKGGVTAYANDVKTRQLGVQAQDILDHGAVSEVVAIQMAEGVRQSLGTDFAISTTGIAGPDGGSKEKPVGTVWIGVAGPSRSYALRFRMGTNRERNIRKSALQALQLLRKEILKEVGISFQNALIE